MQNPKDEITLSEMADCMAGQYRWIDAKTLHNWLKTGLFDGLIVPTKAIGAKGITLFNEADYALTRFLFNLHTLGWKRELLKSLSIKCRQMGMQPKRKGNVPVTVWCQAWADVKDGQPRYVAIQTYAPFQDASSVSLAKGGRVWVVGEKADVFKIPRHERNEIFGYTTLGIKANLADGFGGE